MSKAKNVVSISTNKTIFVPSDEDNKFANKLVKELTGLSQQREKWERTDFKKSNTGLYALLAKCKAILEKEYLEATDDARKTLRIELATLLKGKGIKVQRNSTTLTLFIRFVFGSDRKRAHGYAYVIKAAFSHDIAAKDLPKYIADEGGIEEVKRKMVASEDAIARRDTRELHLSKVKEDAELAENQPLDTLKLKLNDNRTAYAVLVGKPSENGKVKVVAMLKHADPSLINSLFKRIAKVNAEEAEEAKAREQEMASLKGKKAANDSSFKTKEKVAA
jgi:hypothetical protein